MQTGSVLEETFLTFTRMMVAKQATNCIFYYLFYRNGYDKTVLLLGQNKAVRSTQASNEAVRKGRVGFAIIRLSNQPCQRWFR